MEGEESGPTIFQTLPPCVRVVVTSTGSAMDRSSLKN
jgi:hypothetical protein